MAMKYIRYDDVVVVLFPSMIQHDDFAHKLSVSRDRINSAGFVRADELNSPYCYGESVGLDIKSDPAIDDRLLTLYLEN